MRYESKYISVHVVILAISTLYWPLAILQRKLFIDLRDKYISRAIEFYTIQYSS